MTIVYTLLHYLFRSLILVNYRRIYFFQKEPVDPDRPAIVALNHPTAFLDPSIVGTMGCGWNTYYLLRGDIFESDFFSRLLAMIHCVPIYRFRDGFEQMKKNGDTMVFVQKLLTQKVKLVILVEGRVKTEWRLAPIQKGAARIAFESYFEKGQKTLSVIPSGINYLSANRLRSDAFVQMDRPIYLRDYEQVHEENPRKAVRQLTKDVERHMRQLVWHVEDEADDQMAEQYLRLLHAVQGAYEPVGWLDTRDLNLRYDAVIEQLNAFNEVQKKQLSNQLSGIYALLDYHRLAPDQVYRAQKAWSIWDLLLIVILPVLSPVLLFCALPWYVGHLVAKAKVREVEFFGPVRFGVAMGIYMLVVLFSIPFSLLAWSIGPLILALLFPAATRLMALYADQLMLILEKWKWTLLTKKERQEVREALADILDVFQLKDVR